MHQENKLFDDKADMLMRELREVDLESRAIPLGGKWADGCLTLHLFGRPYHITREAIRNHEGAHPTPAVTVLLCRYLLSLPAEHAQSPTEWLTLREFKGAGVLTSVFTDNTQKIIETAFTGHPQALADAAASLGGTVEHHPEHDLSIMFDALPRVPLLLHYNDAEVGLPATCAILFDRSAQDYLDLESLSIIATYLAGNLIG